MTGAAGLSAAQELAKYDFISSITILEAQQRVGGRTCTVSIENSGSHLGDIEYGGEFVHGGNTSIAKLVSDLGMLMVPVNRYGEMNWNRAGCKFTDVVDVLVLKNIYEHVLEGGYNDFSTSLYQAFVSDENAAVIESLSISDHKLRMAASVLFAQTWCSDIESLALYDLIEEMAVDTAGCDEYRICGGYSELWRRLIQTFPSSVKIKYECAVSEIITTCNGVSNQVGVHLKSGEIFSCDYLISTIPVSVLPSIRFTPPLPGPKITAIQSFRTAPATKVVLVFRMDLEIAPELQLLRNLTYLCTDDVEALVPRWWTPWYRMNMNAAVDTEECHNAERIAFCGFLTDSMAARFDSLSDSDARNIAVIDAARVLGVRDSASLDLCVEQFIRVPWSKDPYALGGYANVKLSPPNSVSASIDNFSSEDGTSPAMHTLEFTDVHHPPLSHANKGGNKALLFHPRKELFKPIHDGRVHFAGEACCYFSNRQTVHGAFDTGRLAAKNLASIILNRLFESDG